jgi:16S rRNA pseudouridine516 synthase
MRLDKYVAHATFISRSVVQRAIRSGRVTVAGEVVRDPAEGVALTDAITLDGEAIAVTGKRYLMLHKPKGYVCANHDDRHPVVFELLPAILRSGGMHTVGRLDCDTHGLLLLTDDGDWSHRITSPRHHCAKRYRVRLADPLTPAAWQPLLDGILLHGEKRPTQPALILQTDDYTLEITIQEGKYHQVRRMFAAIGHHVVDLARLASGELVLDPELAVGEYRHLRPTEIALFMPP